MMYKTGTITYLKNAIEAADDFIEEYKNSQNPQDEAIALVGRVVSERNAFMAVLQSLKGNHNSLRRYSE
jgi:CTP synthase (UTP-ammonia lyase)